MEVKVDYQREDQTSFLGSSRQHTFEEDYCGITAFFVFFFPALGGFLYGFDTGASSGATLSLQSAEFSGINWYNLTSIEIGLVKSGSLYGAIVGSLLAFSITDTLGRRRELMIAAFFYFVGTLLTALSPSFLILVLGRLVYGIGMGMAMHGAPLYIAETSSSNIRGTLISLNEVLVVCGMLVGYLVDSLEITTVGGWRSMYGVGGPFALIMGLGVWWLPPSPRWVLRCAFEDTENTEKYRREAASAIRRIKGKALPEEMVESLLDEAWESLLLAYADTSGKVGILECFKGSSLRALIIGLGLVFFQQVTGQPSVLYYATSIIQSSGYTGASDAAHISIFLGLFKVLMTLIAVWKVDQLGRRPLLIIGCIGLDISLFLLVLYYAFATSVHALALFSLLLYVGCYQFSFGPVSWIMLSEVFPLRTRGHALSIAVLVNFLTNAIVTFSFSPILEMLGAARTFLIFGIIGLFALAFIIIGVPETKGLSLEEIEVKLLN